MGQTMLDRERTETRPMHSGASPEQDTSPSTTGWMWTWVIIGILVVLVVIGFLLGIVRALESIDGALAVADDAVTGIGGDTDPLPAHIENINGNLTSIDGELEAVPSQADDIIVALTQIQDTLTSVDGSLAGTSSTLQGTDGSLQDTSGMLQDTEGIASQIRTSLVNTQSSEDNLASENIWQRVDVANGVLTDAESDTSNIIPQLTETNQHLDSICNALPLPGNCN